MIKGYLILSTVLISGQLLRAPTIAADSNSANKPLIQPFSSASGIDQGWEPLEFPNIDRHTRYELITKNGTGIVKATTDNSASGLIARVDLAPGESLVLRWRWKVSGVYDDGNARKKSGDDYPARIYVAFRFNPDEAGFFERAKRKAAALVFGDELPGNALNYIWANTLPKGEMVPNPYTDTTMMIAVESGNQRSGEWVTVERDIVADYRKAFGTNPPDVVGVAIMSDSDNTGSKATAWYGDVVLVRR